MKKILSGFICSMIMLALSSCGSSYKGERIPPNSPFDDDVAFLKNYSEVIVLQSSDGKARVAVMPGLQGRVMTSTAGAPDNLSYGWINRTLFQSGDTSVHMNAFGGEERIWLGPEGGQFSIFFPRDSAFTFQNWRTPRLIDLDAFDKVSVNAQAATFAKSASLTNYSGTELTIRIEREIKVLDATDAYSHLGIAPPANVAAVSYQTINWLENRGQTPWSKETGLLSIWLLGMYNPSPALTMIIPYVAGAPGPVVNDDYF